MDIPVFPTEITPAEVVQASEADLADFFVANYARSLAPVLAYVKAVYGESQFRDLPIDRKLRTLRVFAHAGRYGEFRDTFEHRRAITNALDHAERLMKDDATPVYARGDAAEIIGQLATAYASTFVGE